MKKVSLDTWIQLLGMVGLLGGLIFVGLEMKQSQIIALAAQQQSRTENFINILNSNIKPNKITSNKSFFNPNVLIAGCGTGQQLENAITYENANILAVDLSRSSLAYAKRKMEEIKSFNRCSKSTSSFIKMTTLIKCISKSS